MGEASCTVQFMSTRTRLRPNVPPPQPPSRRTQDSGMQGRTKAAAPHSTQQRRPVFPQVSFTQLYSAQELLNMYVCKNGTRVLMLLFKRSTICSHLTSRLYTPFHTLSFFLVKNVSYTLNTTRREGARPAVLATPAAHMRHMEGARVQGCDRGG